MLILAIGEEKHAARHRFWEVLMGRSFWSISWGVILIVLGGLLLMDRLGYRQFDFGQFLHTWWPLILIIIGLNIIFGDEHRHRGKGRWNEKPREEDHDRS